MKYLRKKCPSSAALDRAFLDGLSPALKAHLTGCTRCSLAWENSKRLAATAKSLPVVNLEVDQKEDIRSNLLFKARTSLDQPRSRSRQWVVWVFGTASAVLVAAGVFLFALSASGPLEPTASPQDEARPAYRASVYEQPGARFTRIGGQPDEMIRLYEGAITVDVQPLQAGERVRIFTGDAEIEVHGTVFDVSARGDRLERVRVVRGRVRVQPAEAPVLFVGRGELWERSALAEAVDSRIRSDGSVALTNRQDPMTSTELASSGALGQKSLRPPKDTAHHRETAFETKHAPQRREPSQAELAFQAGWSALRAGNYQKAADKFAAVGVGASVSEDAAYWRAVALVRTGRQDEAVTAFEGFLELCPTSTRHGEASAALGWLLYQRGDRVGAARYFASAAKDPDRRVRASALKGLETTTAP